MANYSDLTRREQVLARLQAAKGDWVDGPDLARLAPVAQHRPDQEAGRREVQVREEGNR